MIDRLYSTLESFKTLTFKPGMNVILAEKSPGATERHTRNGVGKSSFVELVHFLLGGSAGSNHFLRSDERLAEAAYGMRFDLSGSPVDVERSPKARNDVLITNGNVSSWTRQPKLKKSGHIALSNKEWCAVLGNKMFCLPDEDDEKTLFAPSFRSLIKYFARRQNDGGFFEPQQSSKQQQPFDQQVALTYLVGLDASIPRELQLVRQRVNSLKVLRKAAKDGAFGEFIGNAADLRTRLTVQEAHVTTLRQQLARFHVVPQYREIEREASRLTLEISRLANENTSDGTLIEQLNDALRSETPPGFVDVHRVYGDAGVALPGLVKKRFEDVQRFHRSIVENRRSHLQAEIDAAEERIRTNDREKHGLDARRAELMAILDSGGALEQFSRLQSELSRREADTETLRKRYEAADALEKNSADLDVEKARIHVRLQDDHREQGAVVKDAIILFEGLSNALYERTGSLTISDTVNGPTFEVKIEGSRSKGIKNMQIFCFDMMLMELCLARGSGPGFLIHDSHLFDGVDGRQIARALQIGAERSAKHGFQYIVTMNEDQVPYAEFNSNFPFDDFVNPVRLTDATDTGGLFGFRFE